MGENLQEAIMKDINEVDSQVDEILKSRKKEKIEKSDEEEDAEPTPKEVSKEGDTGNEKEDMDEKEGKKEEAPKEEKKEEAPKEEPKEDKKEEKEEAPKEEPKEEAKEEKEDDEEEKDDKKEVEKGCKTKKSLDLDDLVKSIEKTQRLIMEEYHYDMLKSIQKSTESADRVEAIADDLDNLFDVIHKQGELIKSLEIKIEALEDANQVLIEKSEEMELLKSEEIETLENSQSDLIKSLEQRIDELEHRPVGRKAVVDVFEKSFTEKEEKELSKGEMLTKMSNMLMNGVQGITVDDIVSYESTGYISKSVKDLVLNN